MITMFNAVGSGDTVKLNLYGKFGPSEMGMIDEKMVSAELSKYPNAKVIDVRINSQGGSAFAGLAIYEILKSHPATVNMKIDGYAASAASLVVMAGDTIEMPVNALMMIHDPQTVVQGGAESLSTAAGMLSKLKESCCRIYAERSGKTVEEISTMMSAETWMTGTEAVELGFASKTNKGIDVPKSVAPATMLSQFKCAPDHFASLVSLSYEPPTQEVKIMSEKTVEAPVVAAVDVDAVKLDAAKAERKRAADILSLCEMASAPQMAGDFIANGIEVDMVRDTLLRKVCEERKSKIATGTPTVDAPPPEMDADSGYKAEYKASAAEYAKMGMSEAEYVAQRRIDDGVDMLCPVIA